MNSTGRRSGGGLLEGLYRVIMRRNSVYVTFIIAGAFAGERDQDSGSGCGLWSSQALGVQQCRETLRGHFSFGAKTVGRMNLLAT
ncbi:cytochrome b-c1 complex subunit 9-like isoform X1 [Benincasa hispida]|uniref:cytochrome b-c1 complex subunit 9-like isoform X1 n=1 Tax=Benincasa hispida TaxID=102211 RepID=UPI0019019C17|nr:cytochrome b-c1 complex subunit 9-like isoform X1 [Benincasa hispida]